MRRWISLSVAPFLFLMAWHMGVCAAEGKGGSAMKLTSPAFGNNGYLPAKYTIDGQEVNPELDIEGVPAGTKSFVLIMDDPDAPSGTFTHWVVYDIPVVNKIEENSVPGTEGITSMGKPGYVSPMPPSGTHRYIFRLYALDLKPGLPGNASRAAVEKMMQGHVIGEAELVSLYKRSK